MSTQPMVAELDEDTGTVANRMVATGIRHLPVVDGDEVVGMVSARDLLIRISS